MATPNLTDKTRIPMPIVHIERKGGNHGEIDDNEACGSGQWNVAPLQRCATIGWFTGVNGVTYLMTSCVAAFLGSQLTTLEKQFGFSSRQTGLIMAASNIGYMACVLFVSHLGSSAHIPRALSIGGCCFGLSGIIASIPHFLFGSQLNGGLGDPDSPDLARQQASATTGGEDAIAMQGELCTSEPKEIFNCKVQGDSLNAMASPQENIALISLSIIVFGMVIQGLGKGPRLSYAVTYVDNNTDKNNTGFYSGIMITCSIMGPVLAFLAGGVFSQIYVTLEATDLDPKHPRWIGAWWLGYLTLGLITVAVSLPLQLFPRKLPFVHKNKRGLDTKLSGDTLPLLDNTSSKQNVFLSSDTCSGKQQMIKSRIQIMFIFIKDFVACQIRLWKNPIFVLMNVCSACIIFAVSANGYTAKYLERVFDMPAHVANYTMAARSFVATGLGTFLGGYLTKRMNMTALGALRFNTVVLLGGVLASCAGFFIYCSQPQISLHHPLVCAAECHCTENSFFPVCGTNGQTYYSPCAAGCSAVNTSRHVYTYSGCACIGGDGSATAGNCPYGCSSIYPYIFFSAILAFCQTITIMPKVIVFIRCVSDRDKTASMGLQSFTNSLLGYLSGGLVFGSLIDGVCSVWDMKCGVQGHCLQYDNDLFRDKLHGYITVSMLLALITALVAYIYAKRTSCLSENIVEKQS